MLNVLARDFLHHVHVPPPSRAPRPHTTCARSSMGLPRLGHSNHQTGSVADFHHRQLLNAKAIGAPAVRISRPRGCKLWQIQTPGQAVSRSWLQRISYPRGTTKINKSSPSNPPSKHRGHETFRTRPGIPAQCHRHCSPGHNSEARRTTPHLHQAPNRTDANDYHTSLNLLRSRGRSAHVLSSKRPLG